MKEITIKITFTEEVLGSAPANQDIYKDYIASRSPDAATLEEEIAAVGTDAVEEKQMTIFPKMTIDDKAVPFVYDYQIRGFFKEMCGIIKKIDKTKSAGIKAHKKLIDNMVFVKPRQIPLELNGGEIGICQRPLRASTPQGERVALAMSETAPIGSTLTFTVVLMDDSTEAALMEWLDYGQWKGFGQWRNSGKGRFTYEIA